MPENILPGKDDGFWRSEFFKIVEAEQLIETLFKIDETTPLRLVSMIASEMPESLINMIKIMQPLISVEEIEKIERVAEVLGKGRIEEISKLDENVLKTITQGVIFNTIITINEMLSEEGLEKSHENKQRLIQTKIIAKLPKLT